jgi:hypothetical protein
MRIGLVVCGALVRELITIAKRQGWDFELTAVPAQYHNTPARIAPKVAQHITAWAGRFDLILVGYGDCGTHGALDELCAQYPHVVRIPGPHCYEFYGGVHFHAQQEAVMGTFYLTDFLAHHFEPLVWHGLGLDRHPELLTQYFGHYSELLYLRQLPDQDEMLRAQEAAAKLGLALRVSEPDLGELERRLVAIVTRRIEELEQGRPCDE